MKKIEIFLRNLPYLTIIILFIIILIQGRSCDRSNDYIIKIDTVITYIPIEIEVPGKIEYIKEDPDTIWIYQDRFIPSKNYDTLKLQYNQLGNSFFSTRIFTTEFQIADYGTIEVTDTVSQNKLQGSSLKTKLSIPTETITITKEQESKRQLYIGPSFTLNSTSLIRSINGGLIYKDKKDKLYSVSIGIDNNAQPNLQLGLYWKIKLK